MNSILIYICVYLYIGASLAVLCNAESKMKEVEHKAFMLTLLTIFWVPIVTISAIYTLLTQD